MERYQYWVNIESSWPADQTGLWSVFRELTTTARACSGTVWDLVGRAGISYSWRASVPNPNRTRPVYFLVDVVVSPVEPWFLSVCFYEDEISDPEERGNPVPRGLYDETGYCFDVEDHDPELLAYLLIRLQEAHARAIAPGPAMQGE